METVERNEDRRRNERESKFKRLKAINKDTKKMLKNRPFTIEVA